MYDFNKDDSCPNWKLMDPQDYVSRVVRVLDMDSETNPVERHSSYGGTLETPLMVGSAEQNG